MTADDFLEDERRKRAIARLREIVDEFGAVLIEMQGHIDVATRHLTCLTADAPSPPIAET